MTQEIWKKVHWIATFLLKRLLPKKSLARTSFLAKKQSVPPKAGLQILLEKWGEISGTRFARPTPWVPLYLFLLNWSLWAGLKRRTPPSFAPFLYLFYSTC